MASVQIAVEPRLVTGKKVKALRRQGIIPAHLYGRGTDSLALQATASIVGTLLRTAERNQIIDLKIGGEPQPRPVMLRGVQRNPITDELVHIDFFQISLTEKLSADVPLNIIGEAPAVHIFGGILLHAVNHVTVVALPAEPARAHRCRREQPGHAGGGAARARHRAAIPTCRDAHRPPTRVIAKVSPPRVEVVEWLRRPRRPQQPRLPQSQPAKRALRPPMRRRSQLSPPNARPMELRTPPEREAFFYLPRRLPIKPRQPRSSSSPVTARLPGRCARTTAIGLDRIAPRSSRLPADRRGRPAIQSFPVERRSPNRAATPR